MVVVPLTLSVVNGQAKWTFVSERKTGEKSHEGEKSQRGDESHKEGRSQKGAIPREEKNFTNVTIVVTQHPLSITYGPT